MQVAWQRIGTGLSTVLDLIMVVLFFVQAAVGDLDWIRDEFVDYQFWASVADLGIINLIKAAALVVVYSAIGITHLGPALGLAIGMNIAALAKLIAFVVHKASTKDKLPGLHFALPVFICMIGWGQLWICRWTRNMDRHHYLQLTRQETESFGDYSSIQADYPTFKTPTTNVPRRRPRETEPLLGSDSLSHSVPIAVIASVPLNPPTLQHYAPATGLDQNAPRKSTSSELPPMQHIAMLMLRTLPRKTHIRALRQVHNAFTAQDVTTWLTQTYPSHAIAKPVTRSILSSMIDSGWIESHAHTESKPKETEFDACLFTFTEEATNALLSSDHGTT